MPTTLETDLRFPNGSPGRLAVCGFGLAAAGAGASHAIAANPGAASDGVVLVGAAGTYDTDRHPVGSAIVAGSVGSEGIGAGAGAEHRSAAELGFAESDRIDLGSGPHLLSVASAAGSPAEAAARRARHPEAAGEEMEGYAVAVAARLCGVGLTIVRGFSNVAGDREHGRWQMQAALARAGDLVAGAVR